MADVLYDYLDASAHPATGLLESFPHSADPMLRGVGFTYDLALASLVFSHHRSLERAGRLAEFFRSMPLPTIKTPDFNTAYAVSECLPILEHAFQLGPLAWVSVALARYAEASGQLLYLQKAASLLEWARTHLEHLDGGVVMGLLSPWTLRMSVENNWAYYAALRAAGGLLPSGESREALMAERREVRRWLFRHDGQRGAADPVKALDVYTNALLAGPEACLEDAVGGDQRAAASWAKSRIEELETLFHIPDGAGYDYTDEAGATQAGRGRVSWLEGTEQVALAYQTWAPFFDGIGEGAYATSLLRRAGRAHAGVMRCSLLVRGAVAIPNTDAREPVRTFADGWVARPWTEPAINGTAWAYFVETGFNPWTVSLQPASPAPILAAQTW
jgi:hypothetical protein